ncbi:hypothetical protein Lalb_Chr11g0067071 [Lupinus albus]|uniref:Uncharacterized protein n=1 Tax=Lupinus albus TaxID=3870 RepID=A0A6A4PRZ8_LUPAL|nr:hypothetical protein Lalb_Chr11g0067071 [Lupinus albus]
MCVLNYYIFDLMFSIFTYYAFIIDIKFCSYDEVYGRKKKIIDLMITKTVVKYLHTMFL